MSSTGAISNLGIGSGILTQSLIDQLKTADESSIIKPIQTKILKTQEKQTQLSTVESLMTTTKSYVDNFADEITYLGRKATSSSTDVGITVIGGTNAQSATINVSQLAKNDVWESSGFMYSTSLANTSGSSQTLSIKLGDKTTSTYDINVSVSDTLEDVVNSINSKADGKLVASMVNTGDSQSPYRMVIKSATQGTEGKISITDTGLSTGFNSTMSLGNNLQPSAVTSSSASSLAAGELTINGISIPAVTMTADANTNATALVSAINGASTGATAKVIKDANGNSYISLASSNSKPVSVVANSNASTISGLSSQTIPASIIQNSAVSSNSGTMSSGDITINGVAIPQFTLPGGTASANSTAIINAINANTSQTGVTAKVMTDSSNNNYIAFSSNTNQPITISTTTNGLNLSGIVNKVSNGAVSSSSGSLLDGDIKINGVSISALTLSGNKSSNTDSLVAAINNISNKTGVTAYAQTDGSGNKFIALSSGDNNSTIDVSTTGNGATLSGLATQRLQGNHLQKAQAAIFTYNGMQMSRSTNTVDDVATGMTLTLNNASNTDINLGITQDLDQFSTYAAQFVSNYNTLATQLDALTKYTQGATSQGVFVGVSDVSSIESDISNQLTQTMMVGDKQYSLMDYGFSIDKDGKMSLDSSKFTTQMNTDPALMEQILRGKTTYSDAYYTANRNATTQATTSNIGDVVINGVSLPPVTTLSTNSATDNAQLYVTAINNLTSETGVKASLDSTGKIKLGTSNGGKIQLQTTANGALYSGLSGSATDDQAPITNSIVAIGTSKAVDGIFTLLKKKFESLTNINQTGSLDAYNTSLATDVTAYQDDKTKQQDRLNARYDIMTKQFQMYDAIISKMQSQSNAVTQMINQANKSG